MSFSKAKVHRFNEPKDITPSPASYNVSLQEKVKLGIISKAGTYFKRSDSPHDESGSVHSTPCFQTPTVPRRKKLLRMSFRSSKSVDREELREKTVECNNKDLYIKDLTEQIEEMTLKITNLQAENSKYIEIEKRQEEMMAKCKDIAKNLAHLNHEVGNIRQGHKDLRSHTVHELVPLATFIDQFEKLYNKTIEEGRREIEEKNTEMEKKYVEKTESLKKQHKEDLKAITKKLNSSEDKVKKLEDNFKDLNALTQLQMQEKLEEIDELKKQHIEELDKMIKKLEESEANVQTLQENLRDVKMKQNEEIEEMKKQHIHELENVVKKLKETEAKVALLEENFQDVNLLTDLQMKQKIEEIDDGWKRKLEETDKEHEAILKECQEISEYNIIQSEIEKNMIRKQLAEKEEAYDAVVSKATELEKHIKDIKNEQHAYQLSITTFRDTIEVLKKRLIDSDRDVVQLKEELEKNEERVLDYEKKCVELTNQLKECRTANEELEMQYESTSKLIQNQVINVEKNLLAKVEALKEKSRELSKTKELLNEVFTQYGQQQTLVTEAQEILDQSKILISTLENKQTELESEVATYKTKLEQESEEAAEIRKKYIEKSGKYDALAHQFEQLLQELDETKMKNEDLEQLIGPYRDLLEAYQTDLILLNHEKSAIASEAKDLSIKYAEILSHQNHKQKIKHVQELNMKSTELFQKNMDLEAKNYKLNKTIEKLRKEIEDLRKPGMKLKMAIEDKENLGSPKCLKGVQSPGPLKDKN